MADNYWPRLHELLGISKTMPFSDMRKIISDHPHIVNHYFYLLIDAYHKFIIKETYQAEWYWYRFEYQARGNAHIHGIVRLKYAPNLMELVQIILDAEKAKFELEYNAHNYDAAGTNLLELTVEQGKEAQETCAHF